MNPSVISEFPLLEKTSPLCPVFGECGGCSHQDLSYADELSLKEAKLKTLLKSGLGIGENIFDPIVASPQPYHYRHRLDIALKRSQGRVLFGYQSEITRRMVEIDQCAIAREEVSSFLPALREQALAILPAKYKTANLVVRTGDDGRVHWGGIGRHSLVMKEEDYLWTEIESKKIYYSLETFFQANLSILPAVIKKVRELAALDKKTLFLDLYAGVGLFGFCLAENAGKVIMVEDCVGSAKLARYNAAHHKMKHVEIHEGRVESKLFVADSDEFEKTVAMIDPPRAGLSETVSEALSEARHLSSLLYLSCHPESLVRDLKVFLAKGWKIEKIVPFDFFPKTRHLETLVLLKP